MNEEPFTPSGVTTAEAGPGAPNNAGFSQQSSARQTSQSVKSEAQNLKEAAREHGAAAVEQVKAGVQSATHKAQEAGRSFIHTQKENLASTVTKYAEAARSASQCIGSESSNLLAKPVEQAADQLERLSNFLHNSEPEDLLDEVQTLARRRPEVVFGGMFVVGLLAARFFKASGERARQRKILRGSEWQQHAYSTPEESIVPVSTASTPTIPPVSSPASTTHTPVGTTIPGSSTSTGTGDCGCSTL